MSRVAADFAPLGYHNDPVSGDVDAMGQQVMSLRSTAHSVRQAHEGLDALSKADQVSNQLDEIMTDVTAVAGKLSLVVARYEGAATALDAYRQALAPIQPKADELARQAGPQHKVDADNFDDSLALRARILVTFDSGEHDRLTAQYDELEKQRTAARAVVSSAKEQLNGLIRQRDAAADAAAKAIQGAMDSSGLTDTIIDKFKDLVEKAGNWLKDHSQLLSSIGDFLGWVSFALTLASIVFPVLAPIALAVGAIGAVFSIAGGLGQALKDGNWGAFALSTAFSVFTIIGAAKGLKAVGTIASKGKMPLVQAMRTYGKASARLTNVAGHQMAKTKALIRALKGHSTPLTKKLGKAISLAGQGKPLLKAVTAEAGAKALRRLGLSPKSATQATRATLEAFLKQVGSHTSSGDSRSDSPRYDSVHRTERTYMQVAA